MREKAAVIVEGSIRDVARTAGLDLRRAVRSIAAAASQVAAGDPGGAVAPMVDLFSAREAPSPEALAARWVLTGCVGAWQEVVCEHALHLRIDQEALEGVEFRIDRHFASSRLVVTHETLKDPRTIHAIPGLQMGVEVFLEAFGAPARVAAAAAARFPSYFVLALHREWRRDPPAYRRLAEALDSPMRTAVEAELEWREYGAWLERQMDEPVFDEAFGLRAVYVPLRGISTLPPPGVEFPDGPEIRASWHDRVVVDLGPHLMGWIRTGDRWDALRIVSGGPGSGKSSLARELAAKLTHVPDVAVLYVPLHHLRYDDSFEDAIASYFLEAGFFTASPLKAPPGKILVLILDGLDEVSMRGDLGERVAAQFVRDLVEYVTVANTQAARVKVVLTGREIVVQGARSELRRGGKVLEVLPFFVQEWSEPQAGRELLRIDQRDVWWQRYGEAVGEPHREMPDEFRRDDLVEVTSQPLLNYLFATSYARGKIDLSRPASLNKLYDALLAAVFERQYSDKRHPALSGLSDVEFVRILEEIGVAAWHGDGRSTTLDEVERRCVDQGLSRVFQRFQEGARVGLSRILVAFYFRDSGSRWDLAKTFEFTHRTFGEYLAARRIVATLARLDVSMRREPTLHDEPWGEKEALRLWLRLAGPRPIDPGILAFVDREVALHRSEDVRRWQETAIRLLRHAIQRGIPMEAFPAGGTLHAALAAAANAKVALLCVHSACARVTGERSALDLAGPLEFGAWLARVRGQRRYGEDALVLRRLDHLDFGSAIMDGVDLHRANLRGARFAGASLVDARLSSADLTGAELTEVTATLADFASATLEDCEIRGGVYGQAAFRDVRGWSSARVDKAASASLRVVAPHD